MTEDEFVVSITDRMPSWAKWMLNRQGIFHDFKIGNLTETQADAVNLIFTMLSLESKGLVAVSFDGKSEPIFDAKMVIPY